MTIPLLVQLRSPCFQMRDRPMSPGEMEVERMRERLNQLKQEVNDLAREVSEEQNDYSAPSKLVMRHTIINPQIYTAQIVTLRW